MELKQAKVKAQTIPRLPVCEHVARQIKMKSRLEILVNTKVSAGSHESPCIVFCNVWKWTLITTPPAVTELIILLLLHTGSVV